MFHIRGVFKGEGADFEENFTILSDKNYGSYLDFS